MHNEPARLSVVDVYDCHPMRLVRASFDVATAHAQRPLIGVTAM
jgi:hypothetical protein